MWSKRRSSSRSTRNIKVIFDVLDDQIHYKKIHIILHSKNMLLMKVELWGKKSGEHKIEHILRINIFFICLWLKFIFRTWRKFIAHNAYIYWDKFMKFLRDYSGRLNLHNTELCCYRKLHKMLNFYIPRLVISIK